jgi:hypothetical protein
MCSYEFAKYSILHKAECLKLNMCESLWRAGISLRPQCIDGGHAGLQMDKRNETKIKNKGGSVKTIKTSARH